MKQQGTTLIEILVAIFLFAIGILGIAAMQATSVRVASNSNSLSLAVAHAHSMMDRMLTNAQGVDGGFYDSITSVAGTPPTAPTPCGANCSPQDLAQFDAFNWISEIQAQLPRGTGAVSKINNTDIFSLTLTWTERGKDADETKEYIVAFVPYEP